MNTSATFAPTHSLHMPLKVAVLVSGNGSNLQVLIDAMQANELPINIVGVISNKADAYALTRAKNADIPICVLSHVKEGTPFVPNMTKVGVSQAKNEASSNIKKMGIKTFERHALTQLEMWQPDLIVLAGFMRVLSGEFIANVPAPMINLHPSLLPKFKGLNTHTRAIEAGETHHGCSVHVVTAELDGGAVLTQAVMPIKSLVSVDNHNKSLDADTLQHAVHTLEHQLLPWTVLLIAKQVLDLHNLQQGVMPLPIRLWFDAPVLS